jgi:hypothetical protein
MQIKEMANFIMYVLVELVFSDSYIYFDLNLNAIIIKLQLTFQPKIVAIFNQKHCESFFFRIKIVYFLLCPNFKVDLNTPQP